MWGNIFQFGKISSFTNEGEITDSIAKHLKQVIKEHYIKCHLQPLYFYFCFFPW